MFTLGLESIANWEFVALAYFVFGAVISFLIILIRIDGTRQKKLLAELEKASSGRQNQNGTHE